MPIEDFTTYTESDSLNNLSETSTKVTVTNCLRTTADVFLRKDKGVNAINALNAYFEMSIDGTNSTDGCLAGMGISNTLRSEDAFASTDLMVYMQSVSGSPSTYRLYLFRGAQLAGDYVSISKDTNYYCKLSRVAANDTVTLYVYTDAARTSLVGSVAVSGFGTVQWRYSMGFVNYKDLAVPTATFYGYVQNLDFTPALAPSVSDTTAITEAVSLLVISNNLLFSVSDTTAITEIIVQQIMSFINVQDTSVVSEFVDVIRNGSRDISVSETTAVTELTVLNLLSYISVSDMTTMAELVSMFLPILTINVFDTTVMFDGMMMAHFWKFNTKHTSNWSNVNKHTTSWSNLTKKTTNWTFLNKDKASYGN